MTGDILPLIGRTLRDPAGVARGLEPLQFDRVTLWSFLLLVSIVSVLVLIGSTALFPVESPMMSITPFALAIILFSSLVMLVFAIYWTGRMMGGQGRFPATILLVGWWQIMALVIQIAQTVTLLLIPPVGAFVSLAGLAWLVFGLLHFINVLHGFDNLFKALATVVVGIIGVSFGLSILLALIGVTLQGLS